MTANTPKLTFEVTARRLDAHGSQADCKDAQITLGKNFEGFAPIGPCIVTADAIDPNAVQF